MGCSEPDFWDTMGTVNEPLKDRLYNTVFGGLGADATADTIGVSLLVATGIGIAAHASVAGTRNSEKGEKE
jgi:quinone-reactive Ni/Fe-hydrogenase small subunit